MSLINKMLTDLDARVDSGNVSDRASDIFAGLQPANEPHAPTRRVRPLFWLGLICALTVAGTVFWAGSAPTGRAPETGSTVTTQPPRQRGPVSTLNPMEQSPKGPVERLRTGNGKASTDTPPQAAGTTAADSSTQVTADPRGSTAEGTVTPVSGGPISDAGSVESTQPETLPVTPAVDNGPGTAPESRPPVKTFRNAAPDERAEELYARAVRLRSRGRIAEAENLLRRVLDERAIHVEARKALADLMVRQGRWREAETMLAQGVTLFPSRLDFTRALARLYAERGDVRQAVTLLESALPQASGDADCKGLLAALYQRLGRHREAVDMYSEALALRPFAGRWWAGMGISLEAKEEWAAARDAYLRVTTDGDIDEPLLVYARERLRYVSRRLEQAGRGDD